METIDTNIRKAIKSNFVPCLIAGTIIFFVLFFSSDDILISSLISLGLTLYVLISSVLDDILGVKRHYNIIESKGFQELISIGFKIEEVHDYRGLTGIYKNYIFDIYYDWATYVKHQSYKAVIFNVHFIPTKMNDGGIDYNKLEMLSKKYKLSYWSFKTYSFYWREGNVLMRNGVGIFNPSYKKLQKRMDSIVNILKEENLQPLDRKALIELRKNEQMNNSPDIDLYYLDEDEF